MNIKKMLLKIKKLLSQLKTNQVTVATTALAIPIFVQIFNNQDSFLQAAFYAFVLIFMITISHQMGLFKKEMRELKNTHESNFKTMQLLQHRLAARLNNVNQGLHEVKSSIEKFLLILNSHTQFEIEIVNRNVINAKSGYEKIMTIIRRAKHKVKIISPKKSPEFNDPNRLAYFKRLEAWVKSKAKNDRSFVFQRIIPISDDTIPKKMTELNSQLLGHCQRLGMKFSKSTEIGSKLVEQLNIPFHFILVDNLYLIALFPKLTTQDNGLHQGDECSFYVIVKDRERLFLRTFEKQFDLLYNNGKKMPEYFPTNEN